MVVSWVGNVQEGKTDLGANIEWSILKEGRKTRESKQTVNGIKEILEFLGAYQRVANS